MNLAYLAMLGRRYGRRPAVLQALAVRALCRPTAALLEGGDLSRPTPRVQSGVLEGEDLSPIDDAPADPAPPIDDEDPAFEELAEIAAELDKSGDCAGGYATADSAGGREGRAPEGTSGAPAKGHDDPANVRQRRKLFEDRIDLANAPSGMEQAAAAYRKPISVPLHVRAERSAEGKTWCRCGGRGVKGGGFVPAWFGRDCIEAACPLRSKTTREEASSSDATGRKREEIA